MPDSPPAASVTAVLTAVFVSIALSARADSPAPQPHGSPRGHSSPHKRLHRDLQTHNVGIRGRSSGAVSAAAACNRNVAVTNGSVGRLGPNGASTSQTVVEVPLDGGNVASATQRNAVTEACAHQRR